MELAKTVMNRAILLICVLQAVSAILAVGNIVAAG